MYDDHSFIMYNQLHTVIKNQPGLYRLHLKYIVTLQKKLGHLVSRLRLNLLRFRCPMATRWHSHQEVLSGANHLMDASSRLQAAAVAVAATFLN